MNKIKKYFIVFLLPLIFSTSSFSDTPICSLKTCSDYCCICNEALYNCGNGFYDIKIGIEDRYCFDPDSNANYEFIPKSFPIHEDNPPHGYTENQLKGSFSSKYGGCEISISGKPKKIHMKFKYEEGNKEKPINKFKYYCDKEGSPSSNFDFSTKVRIIYRVDRVEGETRHFDRELNSEEVTSAAKPSGN